MCFDSERPECFTQYWRKARKEHKCCECRKVIQKKEEYQYSSGIWDGEPASYKTCNSCVELRDKIETIELKEGCSMSEASPPFGELIESAKEMQLI